MFLYIIIYCHTLYCAYLRRSDTLLYPNIPVAAQFHEIKSSYVDVISR
jgi:hypothetical protein